MQEAYWPTTANKANPSCPTGDSKVIEVGLNIGETLPSLFSKVPFFYYIYILILNQSKNEVIGGAFKAFKRKYKEKI